MPAAKFKRASIICGKCKQPRDIDSFGRDRSRKSGRYPSCRFCVRKRVTRLRNLHLAESRKRERAASKKCWDADPARRAYHYIQARAKKQGIRFTLTVEFLRSLFDTGKCAYCDRKVSPRAKAHKSRTSVDKLIPNRGYTPKNTVLACAECNRRKNNSSVADLRMLADGIERLLLKKKWGGQA